MKARSDPRKWRSFAQAPAPSQAQLRARFTIGLRHSSWLGRHPILALCVVPLFLAPLLMAVVVFPLWGLKQVFPDTPAAHSGLQPGDLILSLDGRAVTELRGFRRLVDTPRPSFPSPHRMGRGLG